MEIIAIALILLAVVAAQTIVYKKFGLKGIEYKISLSTHEAFEGDIIEIVEEVSNRKILPVPWLKSEISTSRWLDFVGTKAATATDSRFVPSVFVLKPHQKCTRVWKVKCLKRGVFTMNDTSVVSCDVFGLVSTTMKVGTDETLTVLPTPCAELANDMSNREFYGDIIVRRFLCEDPFIISGAREYSGREPMNRFHWNSTAKQNKLMVYNNEFTTTNTALVIMNMQRGSGEPVPCHISYTETFIKVTAFFLDKCCENHIKIGLATNGHEYGGLIIPPNDTPMHFGGVLNCLAKLENECNFPLEKLLEKLDLTSVTDVFFLTAYFDVCMAEFAESLKAMGKNIIFYSNTDDEIPYNLVHTGIFGCYSLR